ncbi:MAG: tetratricopeptide repeat protein [Duncaniella sp.]|nr:tetratricopeptide repeat protein [Duncaniella sp.]
MKRTLYILCCLVGLYALSPIMIKGENENGGTMTADEIIAQADSAYTADDFQKAIELYNYTLGAFGSSSQIYFNLGNSYYRMGQMGKAILAYERALRLDPANKDARENLAFVNARITDRPGERGTFLSNALDSISGYLSSNSWGWIALICFAITMSGILAYMFSETIILRKVGFFGGFMTFILSLITVFFAIRSASIASSDEYAVIIAPSTILSTAPRVPTDRSQEAMLLHEGTRVHILDSVRSTTDTIQTVWYDVEVDNTHRAWINASDVERI